MKAARKPRPTSSRPRCAGWPAQGGAVLALVISLGLLAASAAIHSGEPRPDAFYDAPDEVPSRPGILLRSAPYTTAVPDTARAWRILYTVA